MSRGPGRRQRLLLAWVKRLKPGDPREEVGWFYLSKLVEQQYREESVGRTTTTRASVEEALRRAAHSLAAAGLVQVEKAGRDLVIRPGTPSKPNTHQLADRAGPNTYGADGYAATSPPDKRRNGSLSVGERFPGYDSPDLPGWIEDKLWAARGAVEELAEAGRWPAVVRHHKWVVALLQEAQARQQEKRR